ncbi:LysR family transcriptional regulator [Cohnella nanjingensis]|uniref:LysR family transcriptional regulator n=1 Tax=Cohnella nanjingensis TaxID=1387779 RepID=A0A7X0VET7_9BACL|nr:LysR family transcriptional regulator [Cohnella nanjingensis]MBB6669909.1 LysR family transcriptional regulator [Cohnella nanjingensis]
MDIQLQVFSAVAELRNFSRAAERLHMTQPAVSQHIRALEEALETRLLERNNKSVSLTRAGEIVLHHAREINGLYARMREMVDELTGSAHGPLAIGASYTFGEYMLPLTLARLHETYPEIAPSITIANTADIAERLRGRELDVGIVEGEEIGTGLDAVRLAEDEMVIAAGRQHPLAGRVKPASAQRLAEEPWMAREAGSGTRAAMDRMFAEWGVRPARLMELGSTQLIKETVEAGLGLTLQSRWALRKELGLGSLKLVPAPGLPVRRSFHVLLRKGDLRTRTMELFLRTLREETNKLLTEPTI